MSNSVRILAICHSTIPGEYTLVAYGGDVPGKLISFHSWYVVAWIKRWVLSRQPKYAGYTIRDDY